jgi:hypothetical protein
MTAFPITKRGGTYSSAGANPTDFKTDPHILFILRYQTIRKRIDKINKMKKIVKRKKQNGFMCR